jgi:CheY-like chemotaxis protein
MGGDVGLESEEGKGAEFWFTVRLGMQSKPVNGEPTPKPNIAPRTSGETLNTFAGSKARILLAEDNITNQMVAMAMLKKLGLRADAVANGAEAIRALETIHYDLVLMDVQMPEVGGIEATLVIRDLQSNVCNHQITIIAMTANAMRGDREECLAAGMDDYIAKPVTPAALSQILEKWLTRLDPAKQNQE